MNLKFLLLLSLLAILICDTLAEKPRKYKKFRHHHKKTTDPESDEIGGDELSLLETDDEFLLRETEAKLKELEHARENERAKEVVAEEQKKAAELHEEEIRRNEIMSIDPCRRVHCGAGRVCSITSDNDAECVCIDSCTEESDPRRKVCSNHNETWGSACAVYQHRCWCDVGDERCRGDHFRHVHIEYYGECRDMPECNDDEKADFPRRMRDWLFNIMRDLADREELNPHYLELEKEAETNQTRRWINAAIWKWCDLDGHPHDRSVSRHELFPIRAPLMSLEHCIAPFLDGCDSDNDHRISLKEWGKCLEIDEDELEDRCEEIADTE